MRIGEYQDLEAVRESPHGFFLTDGEQDVLLPGNQTPEGLSLGDTLRVFVYTDSEDRPIATTKKPRATVGEFARLRVVSLMKGGAFLDWRLDKDLFCPFTEQQVPMKEDKYYVVRIYLDQASNRVTCTSKLGRFLRPTGEGLKVGQKVKIMVAAWSPEVITVIIDNHIRGSLFPDEWHERLNPGDVRDAYIKSIREGDGKVAVSLRPVGHRAVLAEGDKLLEALRTAGGSLPVSDKSSPEEIQSKFGLSKSAFKRLIGTLYREGRIVIEAGRIRLS